MAMIHVARGGANIGSFPLEEIREGLRTGRFLPTDMAWEQGMPDWRALSQVMAGKSAAASSASPAGTNALPISSSMISKPKAVLWYQVFCSLLAVVYLLVIVVGVVILAMPAASLEMKDDSEKILTGVICIACGVPFLFASLLPFFFKPKPWLWVYAIVLIALSLTSCCFWPISIPLLIFWLKPDVQRFFGRNP